MTNKTITKDIFERVEKELLARLEGTDCPECGRSAVTVQELEVIRKWLNDHGYIRPPSEDTGERTGPTLLKGPLSEPDTPSKAQAGG